MRIVSGRSVAALLFYILFCAACSGADRGGELVLVEGGEALAPVVVFENAPHYTYLAAVELAEYIEKASGAKPEVIEGRPEPLPERAIWVGYQPVMDELFPDLDFDFAHPEEILIAVSGNHLVIAGRDRWDPENTVRPSRHFPHPIRGVQQEYGTANAVYTFLQDWLDVRWLWPGEAGVDILPRERIAFEPFQHRYHPRIRLRYGILAWGTLGDRRGIHAWDWGRFQRKNLDSSNCGYRGDQHGHAFGGWWERFHESNPEYFALQPDGTRGYHPRVGPGSVKMCKSNPAVWEQWLKDVDRQIETDPIRTHFNAGVNDGNLAGYCLCENCKAWDVPEANPRRLVWEGFSQNYVALSDRQTRFANELARRLKERYPGRDYRVIMLAYGPSLPAPLENRPDDNVIVLHCANWYEDMDHRDRRAPDERNAQQFADWAARGANMWWRPNMAGHGGLYQGMPDVPFGRLMESLAHVVEHNTTGIWLSIYRFHWRTQGPLYYMMAQLAWNPDRDGYEILDDYYRRAFGPADEQMKAYWTLMEDTRNLKVDGNLPWPEAYDAAFFARAGGLLDEAIEVLDGEPEIYARRVELVRNGLEWTSLWVEEAAESARPEQEQDAEVLDRVSKERARLVADDPLVHAFWQAVWPDTRNWVPREEWEARE